MYAIRSYYAETTVDLTETIEIIETTVDLTETAVDLTETTVGIIKMMIPTTIQTEEVVENGILKGLVEDKTINQMILLLYQRQMSYRQKKRNNFV